MKKKKSVWKYIEEKRFYIALLGCLVVVALISFFVDTNKSEYEQIADLNEDPNINIQAGTYDVNIVENDPLLEEVTIDEEDGFQPQEEITINKGESVDEETPTLVIGDSSESNGQGDEDINEYSSEENSSEVTTEESVDEPSVTAENTSEDTTSIEEVEDSEEEVSASAESEESTNETASVEAFSNTGTKENAIGAAPITNINAANLHFDQAVGIHFPVSGDIIIPFSSEVPVFFKTLNQYRTSPAIFVKGNVGDQVQVVSNGIVEKVEKSGEYGMTVTVNHGDGYKSIYGQLSSEDIVNQGEMLEQGAVIGKIEKPTSFYLVEGSHLYFKMIKDEEAVNPMMLVHQ